MVDRFSPSVQYWWFLQASKPGFISLSVRMFRCWVPFQGHEWQMVATQSTVNLLLLSKKMLFSWQKYFLTILENIYAPLKSPFQYFIVIMKMDYCICWPCKMFSVALMWHAKGVFSLCNICRLKVTKLPPLSIYGQFCVHESPFPMTPAFWWQVRKFFFFVNLGEKDIKIISFSVNFQCFIMLSQ